MRMAVTMGRWLQRLGEFQDGTFIQTDIPEIASSVANSNVNATRSDQIDGSPEKAALRERHNPDVLWRMAVLRSQIPLRSPVGSLLVRPASPSSNTAQHCRMCGDALAEGRRYRCVLCQHALWLALSASAENAEDLEIYHGD